MTSRRNPVWAELIQLVPIVSLAFPFIVAGKVDLARAGGGFLLAALLTVPVTAVVLWRRRVLNPILLGTAAWLWLGAVGFTVPIAGLVRWLVQTQAFGLFVGAFVAGIATTILSRHGYVASPSSDRAWIRRASLVLLGLSAATVAWSWWFRHDIRLGGGVPFILLNVVRRVLIVRGPSTPSEGFAQTNSTLPR